MAMFDLVYFSLLVAVPICLSEASTVTSTKDFPWFCLVKHGQDWVSTCTIINLAYVVVSIDNLNQPMHDPSKFYYQSIHELTVAAGTPSQKSLDDKFYQERKPSVLYVGNIGSLEAAEIHGIRKNPVSLEYLFKDLYGVGLNLGLLKVEPSFVSSTHVQTASILPRLGGSIVAWKDNLDLNSRDLDSCVLASWNEINSTLITRNVSYVEDHSCKEAYCNYDTRACLAFPRLLYFMCFKSLTYTDMCPWDRGAAVICGQFKNQVVGILTTAPNCGSSNVPCVYTHVQWLHLLYFAATNGDLK
ncbi:hypothetical protein GE061_001907 [Apolygus lucorum]|uniref:Peptidase S1 domain-containing protein n=1 Tax=Apolygus lucorum TaxID=248454 RepID=A0A8S9X7K6_APOLU|nr:hypothetical protein GE061_001907 [Apolygus lucorum]